METVALALVQADLVASEDVSEGERFDSTKEALDKAGVPMAQFLQMSETKAFQDIYDRYTRLFFVQLRKGRVLKAASSSAMNGSVAAMKLVMDHKDEEPDAVRQKLEEIEAGGDRAFHGAILEIQDKLRRLSERVEVRRATDEQINAARATASERRVEERSAAKVDYRKLLCEKDLLP